MGECVFMVARVHLFPSRTQQLSSFTVTILGWRRPGKITQRAHSFFYERGKRTYGSLSPLARSPIFPPMGFRCAANLHVTALTGRAAQRFVRLLRCCWLPVGGFMFCLPPPFPPVATRSVFAGKGRTLQFARRSPGGLCFALPALLRPAR